MVIDTSALLAVIFRERHGEWAKGMLKKHRSFLLMSTVNLAEVLIQCREKQSHLFKELRQAVFELPIRFILPTVAQAEVAAETRHRYKMLNFGDCFAYALAKEENCPVLTLDGDFKESDIEVLMP